MISPYCLLHNHSPYIICEPFNRF